MSLKSEFRVGITQREVAFGQDCKAILAGPGIHPRFLAISLVANAGRVLAMVDEAGHGTGRLPTDQLGALTIGVPELAEQRRIVEILDSVDESIRSVERLIEKSSTASLALRRHLLLFPGQLTGRNFARIGDVLVRSEYGISSPLCYGAGTPVLRMNNLKNGEVDTSDLKVSAFSVPPKLMLSSGDVLFNRTNSLDHVGRTSIWRGPSGTTTFASYLVRLVQDDRIILPDYLTLWLNLEEIQSEMRRFATPGVHQVNINPTNLKKVRIEFPQSLEEQDAICRQIAASIRSVVKARIELGKLRQLKLGLMEELLTGRAQANVGEDVNA